MQKTCEADEMILLSEESWGHFGGRALFLPKKWVVGDFNWYITIIHHRLTVS
ncbi:hypothetical protein BD311DRAFT_770352 [Dichomitus squalens]|uniref:Uncharacterized protein n=1 Tax=Dichomitus squalens TaxID=114155 RepID=A0A4Q9M984_9APHY|nr:hypothetical protein BD311DRAFT_770352 [Dichomitus squalens]